MITQITGIIPVAAPDLKRHVNAVIKVDVYEGTTTIDCSDNEVAKQLAKEVAQGGLFIEFRSTKMGP